MTELHLAVAAVLGLAFGSFANVVAHRVPAGISLLRRSRCPSCGSVITVWQNIPVLSWLLLRGRCGHCSAPISYRYLVVEVANSVVFAILAWFVPVVLGLTGAAGVAVWAALASFFFVSSVLTQIDLAIRRLPDVIVFTAYAVGVVLLGVAGTLSADWSALVRAVAGMAAMYFVYWIIRFVRPDGMGGGDVKVAGLAGLHLGYLGWGALVVGWLAAFLLASAYVAVIAAQGKVTRRSSLAFGPWLLAGAWVGIWFGNGVWSAYTALCGFAFAKG